LLMISNIYGIVQAVRFYRWKSLHLYSLFLLLPYGAWAIERAWQGTQGTLRHGLSFYLFGFFYATGLAYFRRFRRFSPGVLLTSLSFLSWGSFFPLSSTVVRSACSSHVP